MSCTGPCCIKLRRPFGCTQDRSRRAPLPSSPPWARPVTAVSSFSSLTLMGRGCRGGGGGESVCAECDELPIDTLSNCALPPPPPTATTSPAVALRGGTSGTSSCSPIRLCCARRALARENPKRSQPVRLCDIKTAFSVPDNPSVLVFSWYSKRTVALFSLQDVLETSSKLFLHQH